MKYLLIYITFVGLGICADIFRLFLAKLFKFEVEKFSLFIGPNLTKIVISDTIFMICAIPYGSSISFKESFLSRNRVSRIILSYLPATLIFIISFIFIKYTTDYILHISGILLSVINGFAVMFSIIFDRSQVFYRYKKYDNEEISY